MGSDGRFVVTYTALEPNSAGLPAAFSQDVLARLYLKNGNAPPVTIAVANTPRNESHSSVAMVPDGLFVVAYEDQSGNGDIRLNRYSDMGGLLKADPVATTAATELAPSLALDNAFNAVVAYQEPILGHSAIVARRVSSKDVVSPEIVIRKDGNDHQDPSVALSAAGGAFVVAYDTAIQGVNHVEVTDVSGLNIPFGQFDAGAQRGEPAISIDASNNSLLTYTSNDRGDLNIHGRRGHH
jgi:hypothetical protein